MDWRIPPPPKKNFSLVNRQMTSLTPARCLGPWLAALRVQGAPVSAMLMPSLLLSAAGGAEGSDMPVSKRWCMKHPQTPTKGMHNHQGMPTKARTLLSKRQSATAPSVILPELWLPLYLTYTRLSALTSLLLAFVTCVETHRMHPSSTSHTAALPAFRSTLCELIWSVSARTSSKLHFLVNSQSTAAAHKPLKWTTMNTRCKLAACVNKFCRSKGPYLT